MFWISQERFHKVRDNKYFPTFVEGVGAVYLAAMSTLYAKCGGIQNALTLYVHCTILN